MNGYSINFHLFRIEITKLFSKKYSIDVNDGGKIKKHLPSGFSYQSVINRSTTMSYFDQHAITSQCLTTVQEMLSNFSNGCSSYLPVQEHVAFLFDLMESAININGLLDLCIQVSENFHLNRH